MKTIKLNSGHEIPYFGYGTWQTPEDEAQKAVEHAIRIGFNHIDTAAFYQNEQAVGQGIHHSGVRREDIFLTTKVWNTERGYNRTRRSFEESLRKLDTPYVDLYLIHWPANPFQFDNWKEINLDTWRALEDLQQEGLVRSIGVSNFMPRHLKPLMEKARIMPAVNQIEYHPGWMQKECVDFCQKNGITVEGWSPLAQGDVFKVPLLQQMSQKYGKSITQIVLSWVMACGVIPLSKSVTPSRIEENFQSMELCLEKEDIEKINSLDCNIGKCRNPDLVNY
ncbi:MAG: aldo/keto reductase [Alistipes sp.]|nr:aldo/keto reductase [Candidatus Alistipes equi]